MINRELFSSEHDAFRDNVRRFIEDEVAPLHGEWEKQRGIPRELWRKAGELGCVR
jgi:alkylation response protein AidB-like acyl-CoA dehydrogenase